MFSFQHKHIVMSKKSDNNFSFSSKNDFLYYVLNCYNTLNLDPSKDKLHIFGEFNSYTKNM